MIVKNAKICRVCGDYALAFNYNGLSCEPCKVFFRRNASKKEALRCRRSDGNRCHIDSYSRKGCPKCRLEKCFAIGMEIGMKRKGILHHQLLEEHQIAQIEPTPQSTSSPTTSSDLISSDGIQIEESPQLSYVEFQSKLLFHKHRSLLSNYPVPFNEREYKLTKEIAQALACFEDEKRFPHIERATSLQEAMNLPSNYTKRIIKFCKSLAPFQSLNGEDQFTILKQFFPEICQIRFSFLYDEDKDGFPLIRDESGERVVFLCFDLFRTQSEGELGEFGGRIRNFTRDLCVELEGDPILKDLMIAQMLFQPRDNISAQEFIKYQHCLYSRLLRRYLELKYNSVEQANTKYSALMFLIQNMSGLKQNLRSVFEKFDRNSEVIAEVFGLKEN